MDLYEVDCSSHCGTYFQPYLKTVIVRAESKKEALKIVNEYFSKELVRPLTEWDVTDLQVGVSPIIYTNHDTDY